MACVVAVVAVLVGGCEEPGKGITGPATSAPDIGGPAGAATPAGPGTPPTGGPAKFDCAGEGGKTVRQLPSDTGEIQQVMTNPCVPLAELSALVLGLVEIDEQQSAAAVKSAAANKKKFRVVLNELGGHLLAANDVAECGYQTDRLAIGIYQQQEYRWSVGVVAVIRGDVGAAVDVAACYLENQLGPVPYSLPEGPRWQMCGTIARSERYGESYTVLTAGDTDVMCDFLEGAGSTA